MSVINSFKQSFRSLDPTEMSIQEYLELCKQDPMAYATAAERMLAAIGEPTLVDTSKDPRLSRIFTNRKIRVYPAFKEFYGVETAIEQIVSFFKHAAQGLEERKQILYLLGPVGGGKSSLAEQLKKLMQAYPIYVLKAYNKTTGEWEMSPICESPLGLFDPDEHAELMKEEYGIPVRYLRSIASPWAAKRLREAQGDLESNFKVVKIYPSILNQVGISKTEPGDENNQDVSSLVGKVDIRKLEDYSQDDPDAYSYAGGLNVATQGLMEFVEMFKAPIKMLHPLLTATQDRNYNGTQGFGAIPFEGIILAHSNESEWDQFRNDRTNEAFLDRVCIVKVPYCLRVAEEVRIYEKLLNNSELSEAPCAPGTLEMLAQFSVLTRLAKTAHSSAYTKLRVYNGENLKDEDPKALPIQQYRDDAGPSEGMDGVSTRFAYKILSKVFNFDPDEVSASPITLMKVLIDQIAADDLDKDKAEALRGYIMEVLAPNYATFVEKELQKAYLESYTDYGQNLFDRYIQFADFWVQDANYRDPDTGESFNRDALNSELEKIEKPAGISNPKDFRNEVVNFVLRARASNNGNNPDWKSYEKMRNVIEKKIFANTEDLLPVISFNPKQSTDEQDKHNKFVARMIERGYTPKQVKLIVEWFIRYRKHS